MTGSRPLWAPVRALWAIRRSATTAFEAFRERAARSRGKDVATTDHACEGHNLENENHSNLLTTISTAVFFSTRFGVSSDLLSGRRSYSVSHW